MHMHGMSEMISNHITARLPENHDHFLVNPHGMLFYNHVTASCLIDKLDVEGNVLMNPNSEIGASRMGFVIHGAIHAARRDVDVSTRIRCRAWQYLR